MNNIEARLQNVLLWQTLNGESQVEKKESFFTTAIHEVRNMINYIENPPEQLLDLLSEVLDFTKFQKKGTNHEESCFSLHIMLESLRDMFRHQFRLKNLEWISDYPGDPSIMVCADRMKLLQILTNLIGNACKFTEKGHIKITAEISSDSNALTFSIEDTGIGMEAWHLSTLFTEYKQLKNTASGNQIRGTGLGLAICSSLTAGLGGVLRAESTAGVGSRFFFSIPCKVYRSEENFNRGVSIQFPAVDIGIQRVLLVEDEPAICDLISGFFQRRNVICDCSHQVSASLTLCRRLPKDYYALILTDMHLTDSDGISCAKVLKHFFQLPAPVILLSASEPDRETSEAAMGSKELFDDFIKKPFSLRQLSNICCKYLDLQNKIHASNEAASDPITLSSKKPASAATDLKQEYAEEINLDTAAKMVLENHKIKFRKNYKDSDQKMYDLYSAGQYEDLALYSHSLTGLTAMLGFSALASRTKELEQLSQTPCSDEKICLAIEHYSKALGQI